MPVTYAPLRVHLRKKGYRITDLIRLCSFSSATVAKINKNDYISMASLCKIKDVFGLDIENIIYLGTDADYLRSITSSEDENFYSFKAGELVDLVN